MKNTLLITYSKHSHTFANRKYEELSYPKNQIMCDPILVTLLKMRPHYSHSSRENATPSSGTSPLAFYEEVLIALIDLTIFVTVFNTENVPLITKHCQVQLKNSCLTRSTIIIVSRIDSCMYCRIN